MEYFALFGQTGTAKRPVQGVGDLTRMGRSSAEVAHSPFEKHKRKDTWLTTFVKSTITRNCKKMSAEQWYSHAEKITD